MKSNLFLCFVLFCGLILSVSPLKAGEISINEAEKFTQEQGNQLLEAFAETDLAQKYQKLDKLLLQDVDIDYISQFIIGKYWRQMTTEQRQQYQALFKRYALSIYKSLPLNFKAKINFKITQTTVDGADMLVKCAINYNSDSTSNQNIEVEFRIHRVGKAIMFTDIKVGESSLLLSYRQKFYQMLKQNDDEIEWFLEDFELLTQAAEKNTIIPDD